MFDDDKRTSAGRFRRITTLGQGGMARVELVLARAAAGVEKLLVIKRIRPELRDDPELSTMFVDEARVAARLNHPNVIHTYGVEEVEGEHLLVMEYLEGQSLHTVLQRVGRDRMPLDLHLRVLCDIATGLEYAHTLRDLAGKPLDIVHRDVSPHNVLVTYEGQVKLVDFGIAKAAGRAVETRTGAFKGKVTYAAPEQLAGEHVSRRTDVFALGVMLWEALTRQRLIAGDREISAGTRRLDRGDPKVQSIAPDVPDELAAICDKSMERDPEQRYASAADLRDALERAMPSLKQIGAPELRNLLHREFASDRARMEATIEGRIRELAAGRLTNDEEPTKREGPEPAPEPATRTSTTKHVVEADTQVRPKLSPGALIAGASVIAALLVIGALEVRRNDPTGTVVSAAATIASAAQPMPAPSAEPAATIELSVSAEPAEARISLDDTALPENPFRGPIAKSAVLRRIQVTAPGYLAQERAVVLDRDLSLIVELKPAPDAGPPPRRPAASVPVAKPADQDAAGSKPRSSPSADPTPPPPPPAAPSAKPRRPIDERF